ncbi:MAG TPA: DUF4126 domain-containing protein [Candidatus Dormibacteraeota bacterium]|nr:DUF4126 domain-containing protein [Candidatus Dormibacteraeota bacterium]
MNPALLTLPAAFGLAGASGLNASLPLLIVSLLARLGLVHLASPYDALASDVAFYGLLVLAVVEFGMDKVPVLDSIGHAVMTPVAAAAGAILFASQTGAISSADPGLVVVASVLVGGSVATAVHVARSGIRPFANGFLLGPPLSLVEDVSSALLAATAVLAPLLLPVVIALLILGAVLLVQRRHRTALSAR